MLNIQFEIDGAVGFDRSFSRFGNELANFAPIWRDLLPVLRQTMLEQFQGKGVGPDGAWKPLTEKYARWKAKKYPGMPILQRTGDTFRALTTATGNSIVVIGQTSMIFGVALPYPIYHQRGGKNLPRRPIFDLNESQKTRISKAVQARLVKIGDDAGLEVK